MAVGIFKSEAGRARLEGWYERFLGRVRVPVERREVPTSRGPSHLLLAGDPQNPPLVILHGALASAAHVLPELSLLSQRFRLIVPDLPGQSPRGIQRRFPLRDDSLGGWLLELLDALGVGQFTLAGISWGGFVARQAASIAPGRVRQLILLVPAGIVSGPPWPGLTKIAIPMALYRMSPTPARLRRFVEPLFSTWDDDWAQYMGDAIRDFVLDLRIPPLVSDADLRRLSMPTLVVAADADVSFPGERLLARVRPLVPNVETELLANCRHSPPTTPEFRRWLTGRIATFIDAHPVRDHEPASTQLRGRSSG